MRLNYKSHPELVAAIDDELKALRAGQGRGHLLYDGSFLSRRGSTSMYVFQAEDELRLLGTTPGRLTLGSQEFRVAVLATEGFRVYLSSQESLPESLGRAHLAIDLTFILEALKERIQDEAFWNHQILCELIWGHPQHPVVGQELAVRKALELEAMFVWGPPGTGKTTTIGRMVEALVEAGRRVLILSHTNVAVDAAISKVAERLANTAALREGRVLRLGTPAVQEVLGNTSISPTRIAERENPELAERSERLEFERTELTRIIHSLEKQGKGRDRETAALHQQLVSIKEEVAKIRRDLHRRGKEMVSQAQVVATTLSQAVLSPEIIGKADTTIIDEASMAYIPYIVFAVGLARTSAVVVGDFRQLPPISVADTERAEKWLHQDIFKFSGIIHQVDRKMGDNRLVALTEQHRMHPGISALCNQIAYDGMLTDAVGVSTKRNQVLHRLSLKRDQPALLVDTSGLNPWALRTREHSRYNGISGALSVAIAATAFAELDNGQSLGIITPYSAQARLIRRLLADWGLHHQVTVSTVHSFQGHERDVIIVDLTDSLPQTRPGTLLSGGFGSKAMRLLNVAVSRARARLIIIADCGFLSQRCSNNSSVRQLLQLIEEQGGLVSGAEACGAIDREEITVYDDPATAFEDILNTLGSAEPIRIAVPKQDQALEALSEAAARSGTQTWVLSGTDELRDRLGVHQNVVIRPHHVPIEMVSVGDRTWLLPLPGDLAACYVAVKGSRFASGIWADLGLDRRKSPREQGEKRKGKGLQSSACCGNCGRNLVLRWRGDRLVWRCPIRRCKYFEPPDTNELTEFFAEKGLRCAACGERMQLKQGSSGTHFCVCINSPDCSGLMSGVALKEAVEIR